VSSTSQLTDFSDLYTDLIARVREQSGSTAALTVAKRYINIANQDLYLQGAEKMAWAERRATITTHARYTTGTLTATRGSTALTGSGTAWNTTNSDGVANMRAGGRITISGQQEVYSVVSVGSDTAAVISPAFIGTTDSGLSYTYFEDEYALASDFSRPLDLRAFDSGRTIKLLGRQDFRRAYPRNRIPSSQVRHATLLDLPFSGSTVPVRKVQLAPPPSDVQLIPYDYITSNVAVSSAGAAQANLSADSDEPILPLRWRHLIVFHALYHWYRDRKDDPRSQEAKLEYEQLKERLLGDSEIGQQRPSIAPRAMIYRSRAKRPWRGGGRRSYDVDGSFDKMEGDF
jgi:hypothetical protein